MAIVFLDVVSVTRIDITQSTANTEALGVARNDITLANSTACMIADVRYASRASLLFALVALTT